MQGKGEYDYKNGSKCIGDFIGDRWHGYGVYEFLNGNVDTGEFKEGNMEG
jgi:hypothetical protein